VNDDSTWRPYLTVIAIAIVVGLILGAYLLQYVDEIRAIIGQSSS
jgi:hypothetical protein